MAKGVYKPVFVRENAIATCSNNDNMLNIKFQIGCVNLVFD